jgi:hypothetical protein
MLRVYVTAGIWLVAGAPWNWGAGASTAEDGSPCPLAMVNLAEHMPRLDAEQAIADALGTKGTYSLYANNLLGGVVEYRDGTCLLTVTYRPGAPAALLLTDTGKTEHRLPRDESVVSSKLSQIPAPTK